MWKVACVYRRCRDERFFRVYFFNHNRGTGRTVSPAGMYVLSHEASQADAGDSGSSAVTM